MYADLWDMSSNVVKRRCCAVSPDESSPVAARELRTVRHSDPPAMRDVPVLPYRLFVRCPVVERGREDDADEVVAVANPLPRAGGQEHRVRPQADVNDSDRGHSGLADVAGRRWLRKEGCWIVSLH